MKKAEIINLTRDFMSEGKNKKFIDSIKKQLSFLDMELLHVTDISDRAEDAHEVLKTALERTDTVITLGGLGAHLNDKMKQAVALELEAPLIFNQSAYRSLKEYDYQDNDDCLRKMAAYPVGARLFKSKGIWGFAAESEEKVIVCLPDEPWNLFETFYGEALQYLIEKSGKGYISDKKLLFGMSIEKALELEKSLDDLCVVCYPTPQGAVAAVSGTEEKVNEFMAEAVPEETESEPEFILNASILDEPESEDAEPEKQEKSSDTENIPVSKGKRNFIYTVLLVMFIGIAVVSAGYLIHDKIASDKNLEDTSKLQDLMSSAEISASEAVPESSSAESSSSENTSQSSEIIENEHIAPKFRELYAKNEDIVGWIKLEGTNINYPVMQTDDNDYYLHKDFEGKDSKYGIPFADYENNFQDMSQNTVIYSHNLKDNQMFGDLMGYRKLDFYKANPVIDFDTIYGDGKYKVVSAFITNTLPEHGELFTYNDKIDFENQQDFLDFVDGTKKRSFINTPVDIQQGDEILTLSTCTYEFTAARFVVVARRVRDGEDPFVDVSKAELNEAPLMPDIWYELFGGRTLHVDGVSPQIPVSSSQVQESSSQSESSEAEESVKPEPEQPQDSSSEREEEPQQSSSESHEESSSSEPIIISSPYPTIPEDKEEESSEQPSQHDTDGDRFEDEENSGEAFDEILKVKVNGRTITDNAYDIICGVVENETRGNMHTEAIKAQAVASYTYIRYNNAKGIYPIVSMRSDISASVKRAVSAVLGDTIRYKGQLINATYHSTSCGYTASSEYVWGNRLPYLVPVESPYDVNSPYYKNTYKISEEDFADKVYDTYEIDLYDENMDPEEWIWIDEDACDPGGYVGRVEIGGHSRSLGGRAGRNTEIDGRSIREKLLSFAIKSPAFEVDYRNGYFVFTTYGYGHGVGMSQWGAEGMAKDGYTYDEILTHYYTGTTVKRG